LDVEGGEGIESVEVGIVLFFVFEPGGAIFFQTKARHYGKKLTGFINGILRLKNSTA